MVSDQYAKLEQAGHHQEGGIQLQKVFVDLPVSSEASEPSGHAERQLFVKTLMTRDAFPLTSNFGTTDQLNLDHETSIETNQAHGYLVIGGPGQGKSTVGQLASQLHRAALLAPLTSLLTTTQRDLVNSFSATSTREDLGWPQNALFPIRLNLPQISARLAERPKRSDHGLELLDIVSADALTRGLNIPAEQFHQLLSVAPFLLVLDGLDEVGAPEDRAALIAAVRDLLFSFGSESTASALVVATTRPQGYTGEFKRTGIPLRTVYLNQLNREEALNYGRKLVAAKYHQNPEEQKRVFKGLSAAASEPATARLFTTPLQVTILSAIVLRLGTVPTQRWGLFQRYYETLYDRELERGTYAAKLLRDHKMHIERIHSRVGLILQVQSEQAGATEARISRERLRQIADAVLAEDEFEDDVRAPLVRQIIRAAEERLVFLVEPEPEKFGFEIRSLQEFMAAWALTAGGEEKTRYGLKRISLAPMFRAVTLLIASKLFYEGSSIRNILSNEICHDLDTSPTDLTAAAAKAGAQLALEILEEGAVLNQPKFTRSLMERACGLLDLPPCREQARLARIQSIEAAQTLEKQIEHRIEQPSSRLGAWVALAEAANAGATWTSKLIDRFWRPDASSVQIPHALALAGIGLTPWLVDLLSRSPAAIHPTVVRIWASRNEIPKTGNQSWIVSCANLTRQWLHSHRGRRGLAPWNDLRTGRSEWRALAKMPNPSIEWEPYVAAAVFCANPSVTALSDALIRFTEAELWVRKRDVATIAPWPLTACLRAAGNAKDLHVFARRLREGDLGTMTEWLEAEQKWQSMPTQEVLMASVRSGAPWSKSDLDECPPITTQLLFRRQNTEQELTFIRTAFASASIGTNAYVAESVMRGLETATTDQLQKISSHEIISWARATISSFPRSFRSLTRGDRRRIAGMIF